MHLLLKHLIEFAPEMFCLDLTGREFRIRVACKRLTFR